MMGSFWFIWLVCMFIFLVPPVGYGWGYRSWGAPWPRYIQRRRGDRAASSGTPSTFDHHSWGWGGDFVWAVLLVGMLWACAGVFWWR
jgi:hypothetical protein